MKETSKRAPSTWIQTHSGIAFDLLAPSPADVIVSDIAHALARLSRFSGNANGDAPYSVAQHSVLCADLIKIWGGDARLEREALLHDAAEAYHGDFTFPVQIAVRELHRRTAQACAELVATDYAYTPGDADDVADAHEGEQVAKGVEEALGKLVALLERCDPMRELKATVEPVVREALGLSPSEPPMVKRADMVALAIERKLLMTGSQRDWNLSEFADTRFTHLAPLNAVAAELSFRRRLEELDKTIASQPQGER